jgi:hypothetical protein
MLRYHAARGRHVDLSSPRGYYLDYSPWADAADPWHDQAPPTGGGRPRDPAPLPSEVARWALGNLELYLGNGNVGRRDRFESGARWMIDNIEVIPGSFGGWAMQDPPEALAEHFRPGWFSGAVHAECVSTLVRAAALIQLDHALETASSALGGFATPVEDGGFLREVGGGGLEGGLDSPALFEEYPMVGRRSAVLSGHARALLAVFDYRLVTGDFSARMLFERAVAGLELVLDRYDTGSWARRDLDDEWRGPNLANERQLQEQILLLGVLSEITQSESFRTREARWRAYTADWRARLKALYARIVFTLTNVHHPPR